MTVELDTTLAQAEVLFLSFSQLVADIDRRRAEDDSVVLHTSQVGMRQRSSTENEARGTSSDSRRTTIAIPTIPDNLRELLKASA